MVSTNCKDIIIFLIFVKRTIQSITFRMLGIIFIYFQFYNFLNSSSDFSILNTNILVQSNCHVQFIIILYEYF